MDISVLNHVINVLIRGMTYSSLAHFTMNVTVLV